MAELVLFKPNTSGPSAARTGRKKEKQQRKTGSKEARI
jgi:hypothetical protein